jgi:hypothetical protein
VTIVCDSDVFAARPTEGSLTGAMMGEADFDAGQLWATMSGTAVFARDSLRWE